MKMAAQPQIAGELPLEKLLALYGYTVSDKEKKTCHVAASLPDMTLDKHQITEDHFPGEEEEESSADDLTPSVTSNTSDLLHRLQAGDKDTLVSSSDEDSDDASLPSNEEHKEIMVGSMYQAKIPPLSPYNYQESAYNSEEDQLLWRPEVLPVQEVENFLLDAQRPHGQEGAAHKQTPGGTIRDNEQALYELVKCNFNAEEALRRLRFNVKVFSEELCAWSEEECRNFEHGYKVYRKNFHLIQANKVRTRSVGECVEYYYMWKKSERHEYFTQQATRLSRKKYSLQSGSMEDGYQDGEPGEIEQSNNSPGLLSQSSTGPGKLESPLPPRSSLDLDKQGGPPPAQTNFPLSLKAMTLVQTGHRKQAGPAECRKSQTHWIEDGELVTGLSEMCGDGCPQQLFGGPFSLPPIKDLQDPVSGSFCPTAGAQLQSQPSPQSSQCACEDPPSCHDDHCLPGSCFFQLHMRDGPFTSEGPDCGTAGDVTDSPIECRWNLACCVPHLPHLLSSRHLPPCCSPLPSSIPALTHSDRTWENQN